MSKKELELREIQLNSFVVLKKIKEICENNNIKYFLTYGTLLGAIRHNGFIPWDDDIDVMMPREDYERFIEYCIKNEKKLFPFILHHYKTNKNYIYPIARFSDNRYEVSYTNAKDYGLGLFVDIYPLDGIDHRNTKFKKVMKLRKYIICLAGYSNFIKSKNILKTILKYPLYLLVQMINLNKYIEKTDKLSQKYGYENSKYVDCVGWELSDKRILRKDVENLELHVFESDYFLIPSSYDKLLKIFYNDYMKLPSKEGRIGHHFYKVYKK